MAFGFMEIASTPSVKAAQVANISVGLWEREIDRPSDRFTTAEIGFIAERDSFYLATVSETGWPYVQHRGGPPGFLRVLDDRTLGFAEFRGNRQYITIGNLGANSRACLFLMDYPARRRLKIYAHARTVELDDDPALIARMMPPAYRARPERALVLTLAAFDWNCPQHITSRFTAAEIEEAVTPLRERMAQLEAENAALRARLTEGTDA